MKELVGYERQSPGFPLTFCPLPLVSPKLLKLCWRNSNLSLHWRRDSANAHISKLTYWFSGHLFYIRATLKQKADQFIVAAKDGQQWAEYELSLCEHFMSRRKILKRGDDRTNILPASNIEKGIMKYTQPTNTHSPRTNWDTKCDAQTMNKLLGTWIKTIFFLSGDSSSWLIKRWFWAVDGSICDSKVSASIRTKNWSGFSLVCRQNTVGHLHRGVTGAVVYGNIGSKEIHFILFIKYIYIQLLSARVNEQEERINQLSKSRQFLNS